ncbi:MAG TPA: methyl-accepting chemotaxis protein [Steroidobacteraceae bacterium]|nr:methyl-accepting chemotaxis protein [Steroidobacteraceae bacterium]
MKWFNDMRLAGKLFTAFGLLLAIMLGLGFFSGHRLQMVGEDAKNITEDALPSIIQIAQMSSDEAQMRLAAISLNDAETQEQTNALVQRVRSLAPEIQSEIEKYSKNEVTTDHERALFDDYMAKWKHYFELQSRSIALDQAGKKAEAHNLRFGEEAQAYEVVRESLGEVLKWNTTRAGTFTEESKALVASSLKAIVLMVLVAIAFGAAVAWGVAGAISRPIRVTIETFGKIAGGKLDNELDSSRRDEVGQLMAGLNDMQEKLKAQIEREREAAAATGRIKTALDKASARVMVADSQNQIIYVNDAAVSLFRERQADIRSALPSFSADRLVGSNMDAFHKNPGHQQAMVRGLQGTHSTEVKLGAATIRISATPIVDDRGHRQGTVVEWMDRTQELQVEEEVNSVVRAALDGDLLKRVNLAGKTGFFESLSAGLNRLLDNMSEVIAGLRTVAGEVQRGADEISAGNANLSQRTEEQSSSLEETASSMEEMTSTVKQNADNAAEANKLAAAARAQAENGGAVVGTAVRAMTEINSASKKIADIIGVIDEIAFQTNLLALNAAVEAARAGEQGRGFAVVASEVRSLAGRSATAAKEIKELIQDSVKKVEDGATLVTQSGQTLEQIVISVKKVSDIVAEIAAASREQSSGIEQVNRAVMQMDEMTQQNAALVEEAAAASQSMADQARSMNQTMERYRVGQDAGSSMVVQSVPAPAAAASGKPAAERRGADRPWSKSKAVRPAAAKPAAAKPAAPAPAPLAAASGSDSEWQEF